MCPRCSTWTRSILAQALYWKTRLNDRLRFIGKNNASFDARNYGFTKLGELVRKQGYLEVRDEPDAAGSCTCRSGCASLLNLAAATWRPATRGYPICCKRSKIRRHATHRRIAAFGLGGTDLHSRVFNTDPVSNAGY